MRKTRFAPRWIIAQGILLSGWIVVQVVMVKDIATLHLVMFSMGLALTLLGWLLLKRKNTTVG